MYKTGHYVYIVIAGGDTGQDLQWRPYHKPCTNTSTVITFHFFALSSVLTPLLSPVWHMYLEVTSTLHCHYLVPLISIIITIILLLTNITSCKTCLEKSFNVTTDFRPNLQKCHFTACIFEFWKMVMRFFFKNCNTN